MNGRTGRFAWVVCVAFGGVVGFGGEALGNGTTVTIAQEGQLVPNGEGGFDGMFLSFIDPIIGESGRVVVLSTLSGTSGGAMSDIGWFIGQAGLPAVQPLAVEGDLAPDGMGGTSGAFSFLGDASINGVGEVAFQANLSGTFGTIDSGIFLAEPSGVAQLMRESQPAPDGMGGTNGTFSTFAFNGGSINESGAVGFVSNLVGTESTADDSGIFVSNRGLIKQIVREGDPTPDGMGGDERELRSLRRGDADPA